MAQRQANREIGIKPIAKNTEHGYREQLRHLIRFFGRYRLDQIDRPLCQRFKAYKLQEARELREALDARLQYFGHHPQDPLGAGLGLSERGALEFQEVYVSVGKTTRLRSGKRKLSYRSFSRLFQGRGYTAKQIDWARTPRLNAKAGIRARPVQVNLVRKW